MNQYSTVKPLYPGAFPPPAPEEDEAPYPKAPLNLTLGFDLETWQIPLEELLPSKKVPDGVMTTRKFRQIVSSIREIGLIEPLSVIKPDENASGFLLLDGNLRVLALKELGQDTAPCLIAKDFETHTYNHRINRLSTVQEHYMLRRAIDKGVSKERLARAFSVNLFDQQPDQSLAWDLPEGGGAAAGPPVHAGCHAAPAQDESRAAGRGG
jgi:hypothetical protein